VVSHRGVDQPTLEANGDDPSVVNDVHTVRNPQNGRVMFAADPYDNIWFTVKKNLMKNIHIQRRRREWKAHVLRSNGRL
jgi:hypothetical protein